MAGTTGLEPAASAVTGQGSDSVLGAEHSHTASTLFSGSASLFEYFIGLANSLTPIEQLILSFAPSIRTFFPPMTCDNPRLQ